MNFKWRYERAEEENKSLGLQAVGMWGSGLVLMVGAPCLFYWTWATSCD
jgi:hypothetical protein